ncbi:unnamed protein product [Trichobilharzia regenti]|nr:unnamed protein product [Trichobilharzia regenti]
MSPAPPHLFSLSFSIQKDSKLAIFGDVSLFEESILAITHNSYDPNQIPDEIEEAIDYAVGHVTSSSLTSSDRKYSTSAFGGGGCSSRSESRCTLRSTKQQQHSGIGSSSSTTGSGLDISAQHNNHYSSTGSGLSCHASELSLQSSISVSTNSSWNNNNNIGSGNSNGNSNTASYNNHSQSTIHASNPHCDALNSTNINNTVSDFVFKKLIFMYFPVDYSLCSTEIFNSSVQAFQKCLWINMMLFCLIITTSRIQDVKFVLLMGLIIWKYTFVPK